MWNCRGSSRQATAASAVCASQPPPGRSRANFCAISGTAAACAIEVARAVEQDEGDEDADREEGEELHHRLHRDRQHHAVLVLGGVGVAGAEEDGEERERGGDEQREVADDREHGDVAHARHHRSRRDVEIAFSCSAI